MMADFLLRKNEIEKAIQQYKDIIERNPSERTNCLLNFE